MTETKPYVVGIDIGGTNTVFGVVDTRGNVLTQGSIKTPAHAEFTDYVEQLYTALSELIKKEGYEGQIAGIGVGAPNACYYTGNIESPANLRWTENGERLEIIPFAATLREKFGLPVAITNDANAAAIGEMTYGAARGMKDFIMITLGTGVGSGIVVNGQLLYGHDGFAGELGHVTMRRENGRLCGCGRKGCLEAYASATGVARTVREYLETRSDDSLLRKLPIESITSKDVYDAAMAGDELAREVFDFTGNMLGEAFADFIAFSSPKAIILFGGLTKAGDLIMRPIRESLERNVMRNFKGKTEILFSQLKEGDAAILGASALGWEAK